jgi:DNA-binding NarL/FixJ family response regulator
MAMTRILIADDSPPVRQGLRNLLKAHADWEVCGEAIDGQDAIAKTRQLAPDVIVMDYVMPTMDGIEAARKISSVAPTTSILLFRCTWTRSLPISHATPVSQQCYRRATRDRL